ncbi:winged helix-turn-helix domain-containing protein [Croceicoccus naphthovorans]|uniref:ModE family transcriptional regulator n=1 Tax=Croceicoccus naphthovorans TaxID=1348774 RepID=A0A0G3XLQ5_9SPHN|nr:LysR family transcriptional regulator [Croceicoccus naphthovorans]AKM11549.1 ModE family transcriptional regulator [Croceicoccus naphthovorans]MBB3989764.1 molybdate transport system regulatory protein [Croceicoccus naphthovorans]
MAGNARIKIKVQIFCGEEIAMGPGKADLMEAIAATGSISAAARDMGMSYRRAWLLVDAMNRCWTEPLVRTKPGGAARSGAELSELGRTVLSDYRDLQEAVARTGSDSRWHGLETKIRPAPVPAKP